MNKSLIVYVGTYTQNLGHVNGQADGIYAYRMNAETGALTFASQLSGVDNPSFLAIHPNRRFLYAANETPGSEGVSAFALDFQTGGLTFLNRQPAYGGAACFVSVDRSGRYLLLANYMGGNVVMYPLEPDGKIGAASCNLPHQGYGPNPQKKAASHAHSITPVPDNRFALACDLGLDKMIVYGLDLEGGHLWPNSETIAHAAGAGPRHLDFHPNGKIVYIINELDGTLTAFAYDAADGKLAEIQTVSTLPEGYAGRKSGADVHVHPSGRFLYGSNRGHDSLVIYGIDEASGRLTLLGHESTLGKTPRSFAIDPTGNFLLAANQDSGTVAVFRINPQTGALTFLSLEPIPTPVCLKFLVLDD